MLALAGCEPGVGGERPWPLRAYCAARDWIEREDFRVRGERQLPDPCEVQLDPTPRAPREPEPQDEGSDSPAG
jgi:hypothetical protein